MVISAPTSVISFGFLDHVGYFGTANGIEVSVVYSCFPVTDVSVERAWLINWQFITDAVDRLIW